MQYQSLLETVADVLFENSSYSRAAYVSGGKEADDEDEDDGEYDED